MKLSKSIIILSCCIALSACKGGAYIRNSYKTETITQAQVSDILGEPYNIKTTKNGTESWYYRKRYPTRYDENLIASDLFTIISFDENKIMNNYQESDINYARPIPANEKPLGNFDYTDVLSTTGNKIEFGNGKTPKTIVLE